MGMKSELRRRLSKTEGRLRREGRRLASVFLCGALIVGNLSAVPVSVLADDDNDYTYEIEKTALQTALQTAVSEGNTVSEELEFAGEHAEEYAELLEADGTLYELELSEEEIDEDDDRDKALDLRIFARIEGDIPVDEAYEINGSEEIVFLLSNKTEKTATATISVDGLETDVITILPVDSIAVKEESAAVENAAVSTAVSGGVSVGGFGSGGSGGSAGGSAASIEETESAEEELVIEITNAEDTNETEAGSIGEDSSVEILDSEDSAVMNKNDANVSDAEERIDPSDQTEAKDPAGDTENGNTGIGNDDTKDTDSNVSNADVEDANSKDSDTSAGNTGNENAGAKTGDDESEDSADSDSDAADTGSDDTSDAGDTDDNNDNVSDGSGNDNSIDDAGTSDNSNSSDISEDSEVSVLGSAISIHDSVLLAASIATNSDADEEASASDADNAVDGIVYESVRFDKEGAAAFATTAADLKLDEIEATKSEESVEYTAEADGVSVTVTAPEGALPDGAELSVTVYEEDSYEYAAAAEAIDYTAEESAAVDADVDSNEDAIETASEEAANDTSAASTGLAVLDISFLVDGKEVEPTEAVTVSIDASGIVPKDADASTIEVQHLIESGDELEATLMADATDGTDGTVDTDSVTVKFEVESFSAFTITWRNSDNESVTTNSSTITCNVYGRTGNTEAYSSLNDSGIDVVLTEGMEYDFMNGDNATIETEAGSGQGGLGNNSYVYRIEDVEVISGGETYTNVQTISYDGNTYTITYTVADDDGNKTTVTITGLTSLTVNLYYTREKSNSTQELDLSSYNEEAYVWWDTFNGETNSRNAEADGDYRTKISYVKLNDLEVEYADSSTTNEGAGWKGEGENDTLSDYFPGGTTTTAVYSTLEIMPVAGYYVTEVVVACTGSSNGGESQGGGPSGRPGGNTDEGGIQTPYNCKTWDSDNAFVTTFSVGTSGAVTIDVSSLAFSHSSNSDNYFILICVAPIPSPLYVEYDYGEIVNYIEASEYTDDSSAFSKATGWTTTSSESNEYGEGYGDTDVDGEPGVKTENTQYKYAYSGNASASAAASWKHYANTIATDAKKEAAAAGYVFAGWKAEYYTKVTVASQSAKENGYQYDYNSWVYTFSDSYGSTSIYYDENDSVNLITNVRLIAQWIPIGITVTKEVKGLTDTSYKGKELTYTLEVQKYTDTTESDDEDTTENWNNFKTINIAVTVDGSAGKTIYPLPAGTYRVVETSGNESLSDGTYIYYIAVDTGDSVEVAYNSEYNMGTVEGTSVALLNASLKVTNSYTTGVELPETGGPGTTPFRIAGLLLTSCSAYLIYETLRRKKII